MQTLVRPGRRAVLVKIEGRKGTRFMVGAADPAEQEVYFDLGDATRSFENVERGKELVRHPRTSLAQRICDTVPRDLVAFLARHASVEAAAVTRAEKVR